MASRSKKAIDSLSDFFSNRDGIKPVKGKKAINQAKTDISQLNQDNKLAIYGADDEFNQTAKEDFRKIRDVASRISNQFNKSSGGCEVVDLLTKTSYINNSQNRRISSKTNLDIFNNIDLGLINDIFVSERDRISSYNDYDVLYDYIPQLAQATNAIVDNIMSPDDFTKDVFSLYYENESIDTMDESKNKEIVANLRKINKSYRVEKDAKNIIKSALINGDYFEAVISLNEHLNKMLTESNSGFEGLKELSTADLKLNESEKALFLETIKKDPKKRKETFTEEQFKAEVCEIVNDFDYTSSSKMIQESNAISAEFANLPNVNGPDLYMDYAKKKFKYSARVSSFTGNYGMDDKNSLEKMIVTGSYRIKLDPRRVIKIYNNGVCYGYYYLEPVDSLNNPLSAKTTNRFYSYNILQAADLATGSSYFANPKVRMVVDVFARALSDKLNKKFIATNPQFKMVIFDLLKQSYMYNKRIRVTYFNPNEVVHFYPELDKDTGYGVSIYKKVLFSAKLYISVLMCNLMMKLSRSQDRRTFFIETGLDRAAEEEVYQLVRDIKAKDIRMSDLKTIDSIFNVIGRFQDFVIPTTGGDPQVRIESTPGQNQDIEDDLLEYLRKTMISGIGVPSSYTAYADEMEYARSVSMMNGQFLRSIVIKQALFSSQFSDLFKYLYINDFVINGEETTRNDSIDLESIEVKFPSPASLNITNLTESFNNVKGLMDAMKELLVGDDAGENQLGFYFVRNLVKKFMPMIDWQEIDGMLNRALLEMTEDKAKKKANPEGEGDMGGDSGFGGGGETGGEEGMGGEEGGEEAPPEEEAAAQDEEQANEGPESQGGGSSPKGNEAGGEPEIPEMPKM